MVSFEELQRVLHYSPDSGLFVWKVSRGGKAKRGSIAGSIDSKGYVQIRLYRRLYLAHRLAWLYVYGSFPDSDLDHIDRNPQNNAIGNLRLCTHAENHQNTGVRSDNTSGVTGVHFDRATGKWIAYINRIGVRYALGRFANKEDAIGARLRAKKLIHRFSPDQCAEHGVRWSDVEREAA